MQAHTQIHARTHSNFLKTKSSQDLSDPSFLFMSIKKGVAVRFEVNIKLHCPASCELFGMLSVVVFVFVWVFFFFLVVCFYLCMYVCSHLFFFFFWGGGGGGGIKADSLSPNTYHQNLRCRQRLCRFSAVIYCVRRAGNSQVLITLMKLESARTRRPTV